MLVVALAGCGGPSPETKAAQDARDVAMVERMSKPPLKPIAPEPISADQMRRLGLDRISCAFSRNADEPAIFLAGLAEGFMQVDGEIERLAAREHSAELPGDARSTYIGLKNWVDFQSLAGEGPAGDARHLPMRMILHDAQERVVFTADGTMSCLA